MTGDLGHSDMPYTEQLTHWEHLDDILFVVEDLSKYGRRHVVKQCKNKGMSGKYAIFIDPGEYLRINDRRARKKEENIAWPK